MEKKKESIAISLIALIIGILALLLSWVPIVNNLAAIFAVIGFIFGIIAIIVNRKNKKTLAIVGLVVSVISFAIVMATQAYYGAKIDESFKSSNTDSNKSTGKAETSKSKPEKEASGWDEATKTFTTKDGIIKIDKIEKTTDYEGKPAVKVYFTVTNKTTESKNVQSLYHNLTRTQQKSKNTSNDLQFAMPDFKSNGNNEENHLNDNINPEGTVSGFYPFKLENETDPIQILFQKNYKTVATYEIALN